MSRAPAAESVVRWFPLDRVHELEAAIAEGIDRGTRWQRRDFLAFALGLHGMRVGEVCRAKRAELREDVGRLIVPPFKRGRPRVLTLDATVIESLLSWYEASLRWRSPRARGLAPPAHLLYSREGARLDYHRACQTAVRLFNRLLRAGHGLSFHSLRHTFAMRLYAATRDLSLVQQMLGHRTISSTEVYARSLAAIPDACLVHIRPNGASAFPANQLRLFDGDQPAAG